MPESFILSDRAIATKQPRRHFRVAIINRSPTKQFFSVSCRVDQTRETAPFVNDPSSVLAAGEHFRIITSREQSDRALGHVLFIFKINFRSQIMLKRLDVAVRFVFWNLPP